MKKIILPALILPLLWSCDASKKTAEETNTAQPDTGKQKSLTFDTEFLNKGVKPQEDFFEFSNGSWLKENPVPASESSWGSFNELDNSNKKKLTAILDEFKTTRAATGTMPQILGHYYASYSNMEKRNELGTKPILDEIRVVRDINDKSKLVNVIADHHKMGIGSLFAFGVTQDLKDVDNHIAGFWQGGIGLPSKEYYLQEDKRLILKKYHIHIKNMMIAYGYTSEQASSIAEHTISFETLLAENMMAPAELRIPENTYNKVSVDELAKMTGSFDFERYLSLIGIESFDSLVVGQPKFAEGLNTLIGDTKFEVLKDYLQWKIVDHYAGHLNDEMVQLNFDFFGGVLSGKKEMKPINERAINEITGMPFGELLGKAFVAKHYSDEAQARVNTMVDNLLVVFRKRLNNLDWMTDETKKQAITKLNSIGRKLGFPSKWEDFSSLNFTADDYIGNIREISMYSHVKNMKELNEPVDKDEWGMPAHMVNAYYHPLLNEIAFPAGIMQAPFFSNEYEDAVNYGRIGMVIGHELTHGFDDMGSKFAADGSFTNWWSADDRESFEKRTERLGNTFAEFCPIEGHCVNPALTMGENIADLGGLTMAYHAYTRTEEFKSGVVRDGYTPAQRFFISYAQLWKINYTDEEIKNRTANDPHSPGMYRVNGPLMNCPEFFEAFGVLESDAMRNSESKIAKIW